MDKGPTKMQRGQAAVDHKVAAGRAAAKTAPSKRTKSQKAAIKEHNRIAPKGSQLK